MNKKNRTGMSLLVAALIVSLCAPVMAQSTVLTGKVERGGERVRVLSDSVSTSTVVLPQQRVTERVIVKERPVYRVVERPVYQRVYVRDNRTYWQRHPKVKAVAIGSGVGAGAGAVTGLISGRGVLRGAAIGAGTGAGVGLVRSSHTMQRHPIVRDVATGTLVGLGFGAAASRRGKRMAQGAGVGAAVGLGLGLLRDGLH